MWLWNKLNASKYQNPSTCRPTGNAPLPAKLPFPRIAVGPQAHPFSPRKIAFFTLSLASLIIAGCTVGPDYHKPRTSMPTTWASPTTTPTTQFSSNATTQPVNVVEWWTTFNDPALNSLITRALQSNLDLKQAESRIRQARANRGIVASGQFPTATANGGYSLGHATGSPKNSTDFYQAGLDASWELDIFGGIRRSVEAADADIMVAVEDRRDVWVSLAGEVAFNYIQLRGLQQQLVIAKENLATQLRSADLTRIRFKGGLTSSLDVANAEAQVAATRSQLPVFESAAQQTIYNLSVLLGREPAALLPELSPESAIPTTPPNVPIGLPSELLRRRPDIRRAEAQLHSATARIGIATADLFPKFSLTGSLGTQANNAKSLVNWDNRFWSIGPSVSWTVFDAGRIRSNIQVQNELEEQALLTYQKTILIALQDVESSLVSYIKEQQHRQALAEAVEANSRAVNLSTQLYTQGQTDFLNVLTAQRSLLLSQDALSQSNRAVSTDLVSLYKALGGGWEIAPPVPPTTRPVTQ